MNKQQISGGEDYSLPFFGMTKEEKMEALKGLLRDNAEEIAELKPLHHVFATCIKTGGFNNMLILEADQILNYNEPSFNDENEDGTYSLHYTNINGQPTFTYFLEHIMA